MKKYKNIDAYLKQYDLTRDDMKSIIADAAILLAMECSKNFDEDAKSTEKVTQPLHFLKEILDLVE